MNEGVDFFNKNAFSDAFNKFKSLENDSDNNTKLEALNNRIISEYYMNGAVDHHKLVLQLKEVIDKVELLNKDKDPKCSDMFCKTKFSLMKYNYAVALLMDKCYHSGINVVNDLLNNTSSLNQATTKLQLLMLLFELEYSEGQYSLFQSEKSIHSDKLKETFEKIQDEVSTSESSKIITSSPELEFRLKQINSKFCEFTNDYDKSKLFLKEGIEIYEKKISQQQQQADNNNNIHQFLSHWLTFYTNNNTSSTANNNNYQLSTLYSKAKMSYLKGNYIKCINFLETCMKINLPSQYIYNSIGMIHFLNKKYGLSLFFYNKAILSLNNNNLLESYCSEIYYNMGLCYLYNSQPAESFKCFLQCRNRYISRPKYWIRLAECCIESYNKEKKNKIDKNMTLISKIVENDNCLRYYLECINKDFSDDNFSTANNISLMSGVQYLFNALFLVKHNNIMILEGNKQKISFDIYKILYNIYAKLAYVYTLLNDPQSSLKYLKQAWEIQGLSTNEKRPLINLFISNYISLNQLQEAVSFLQRIKVEDYTNSNSALDIYVNLANLYIYSNQYENAKFYLKLIFNKDKQYLPALRSYLYLLIYEKKYTDAITIIKTHTIEST